MWDSAMEKQIRNKSKQTGAVGKHQRMKVEDPKTQSTLPSTRLCWYLQILCLMMRNWSESMIPTGEEKLSLYSCRCSVKIRLDLETACCDNWNPSGCYQRVWKRQTSYDLASGPKICHHAEYFPEKFMMQNISARITFPAVIGFHSNADFLLCRL